MTVSESDIIRDEAERSSLERAISDLETAIAVSNPGTRRILELSLNGAKLRVATLDKKIEGAKVERAAEVQAQAVLAAKLAAKETALSASEREAYRGFLEKEYFTKKDFGKLDEFYTHSYDRLSEGGKDEMSKRIHEGIRRGEFKFSDLPERVQEKDNAHGSIKAKREASAQTQVDKRKTAANHPSAHTEANAVEDIDIGSVGLKDVKLVDANPIVTASSVADASGRSANGRS